MPRPTDHTTAGAYAHAVYVALLGVAHPRAAQVDKLASRLRALHWRWVLAGKPAMPPRRERLPGEG